MSKIIDLSHEITPETKTHPYDDPLKLVQNKYLARDRFNGFRLDTSMHAGTHIDVPMHLTDSEEFISEIPLECFYGPGHLLDLRNENTQNIISKHEKDINNGDIVLLYTGHDQTWGTETYYQDHPLIDGDLCRFLIERKVKMVGMDLPSPDVYPFEIHQLFFGANVPIIENLANLSQLPGLGNFEVYAFPLKIRTEASLSRVVAKVLA